MRTKEVVCKIVRENSKSIVTEVNKGLLDSKRFKFDKKPERMERDKIEKCLKSLNFKAVWGDKCILIK